MAWDVNTATQFARSQGVDLSGSGGLAQGGVLDRAAANNPQLRAAMIAAQNAANGQSQAAVPEGAGRGVVPMTTEPLHGYEKTGLTQLANQNTGNFQQILDMLKGYNTNPSGTAGQFTNPMATQYMGQAGAATSAGIAPVTAEQIQGVANPYATGMKQNLTEAGQRARATITGNQGMRGARSFGDTSTGQQLGAVDAETLKGGREIDFNAFEAARDQLNNERNRTLSGGGQFGQLASGAQGITSDALRSALAGLTSGGAAASDAFNISRTAAQDTLGAGNYIRKYNQGINDKLEADILGEGNYDEQQLQKVLQMLKSTFGNTTQQYTPKANAYDYAKLGVDTAKAGYDVYQNWGK